MKIGDEAPDFTLKDGEGRDWQLSDFRGKTVVMIFYPADNSPVCTKQLCSIGENWEKYQKTGAEVVGISTDSVETHQGFSQKFNFPFPLLADENGEVIEKYAVKSWIPGRSARAVVVIDKHGKIAHYQVQPISLIRPKDDEVLNAIARAANN